MTAPTLKDGLAYALAVGMALVLLGAALVVAVRWPW
jgi:hypothetical protein